MDSLVIEGGIPLSGRIAISGAKNAALPLMVASLLTDKPVVLTNMPDLMDVRCLVRLLELLGVEIAQTGDKMELRAHDICSTRAPYELVSQMRASFWVLGPLLARCGTAQVSLPGGCAIGTRPVNYYLQGLDALGAQLRIDDGYVVASAPKGLHGADITLPSVSVGASHVLMMAASMAQGTSHIRNAAREPEVVALGEALQAMGVRISGLGTSDITIAGRETLGGCTQSIIPDRVEAGAYALLAGIGQGTITLENITHAQLGIVADILCAMGADVVAHNMAVEVRACAGAPKAHDTVHTAPYPGFATDLQAPFMAAMTLADGVSRITETVFENRFMHVQELVRMGANIQLDGDTAYVTGVKHLVGAPVMATDLRASMGLVVAGLVAQGTTTIHRVYHLDRGFAALETKLQACGAHIVRQKT